MKPTISVILPVYNGEKYLAEAIESVLGQNFKNFELIVINDGSKDSSLSIVKRYMSQDSRIKLISRENRGLIASLNEGISSAKGSFIARMDADDICLPTRFEEQLEFMENNNLDLCGSWVQVFNEHKDITVRKYPKSHEDIIITSMFHCSFAHPATMIRRKVFESLKYEDEPAEDYALWCKIILNDFKTGNISKVLLKYREHDQQITKTKINELNISANNIANHFGKNLGLFEAEVVKYKTLFLLDRERKRYSDLVDKLDQLVVKYGANIEVKPDILLWLYLKSQPKTPLLYYQYSRATLSNKKNLSRETALLLRSFLYLQPDSKLLNIIRKSARKALKI